jgi:drug/metabolite transporter (DMT)-like permease
MNAEGRQKGIHAALASALFLGVVPIFGKMAIGSGFSPLAVISIRTSLAALFMLVLIGARMRSFLYIYPVGLIGCLLAGLINGLGSILYYTALARLDAGVGHMIYSFYPFFVAFWLVIDRHPLSRLTLIRLLVAVPAVVLLIAPGKSAIEPLAALMMLASALLYALHMLINQRILFEAPAPTVALYTLVSMAATVDLAFLLIDRTIPVVSGIWWPVLAMAVITFFSRLALFMGIKHLGGLQTAIFGLAELFVTIILAQVWLGERLLPTQWIGAALLSISLLLVGFDHSPPAQSKSTGWLAWLNPANS